MRYAGIGEHGGDPRLYHAIQRWLNDRAALDKPEVLADQGKLTIAALATAGSDDDWPRLARAWAEMMRVA